MFRRRRFSSFPPRDYGDKVADAMGDAHDSDTARNYGRGSAPLYARGSGPLRRALLFRKAWKAMDARKREEADS